MLHPTILHWPAEFHTRLGRAALLWDQEVSAPMHILRGVCLQEGRLLDGYPMSLRLEAIGEDRYPAQPTSASHLLERQETKQHLMD